MSSPKMVTATGEMTEEVPTSSSREFDFTTILAKDERKNFLNVQVLFGKSLKIQIVKSIQVYSPLIIWILGTIGSVLAILVLRRPSYRNSVSTFILKCLCVVNFMAIQLLLFEALLIWNIDLLTPNITFCRIYRYMKISLLTMSSWTLVILAIGRTVAVYKPFLYKELFSFKKVQITLTILYLSIAICYCPALYTFKISSYFDPILGKKINVCLRQNADYYLYTFTVLPWMDCALYSLIPFIILSITSVLIIKETYKEHRNRIRLTQDKNAASKQNVNINSLLIGNSVSFLVLTFPYSVFYLLNFFTDITKDFPTLLNSLMFVQVGVFFRNLNTAATFYMYFISGSRFRKELKMMLQEMFKCDGNQNG